LRKSSPALQVGTYTPIDILTETCFIYRRDAAPESFLIALNFTDADQSFTLADVGVGQVALSTYLDRLGEINLKDIQLRPNEGLIIQL
jgi:hypothetical protein